MKTKWFRILYVFLIAFVASVMPFTVGCLYAVFTPLLMFAVPYYLKERNIRRYLINGIVIFLLSFVMVNLLYTGMQVSVPQPHLSAQQENATLSNGTVEPFGVSTTGYYNFSVVYTNVGPVQPSDIELRLNVDEVISETTQAYPMTGDTSGPPSNGWRFWRNLSLPEGFYYFNFTAIHTSDRTTEVETVKSFGPRNAPWTTYASGLALFNLVIITFPFTLYLVIVGMYWWAGKARTMRGPARAPSDEGGGGFECTNCGAEVSATATRCHRCGAVFDEEEPVVRAKKVEKGRETEFEEESAAAKKKGEQ